MESLLPRIYDYYRFTGCDKMILPDFVLPSRVNQTWSHSGIDSLESCLDKKHFESYPHDITYSYNSRGFRDTEWPNTIEELQSAIWCVGDSFTVGIGSPLAHTWPWILQRATQRRVINVSMDGASNNWIARKTVKLLQEVRPKIVIIHWSYVARRELDDNQLWSRFYNDIRDTTWPECVLQDKNKLPSSILEEIDVQHGGWQPDIFSDELRILQSIKCSVDDDIQNTLDCIKLVDNAKHKTQVVHSFIPHFVDRTHRGIIESQITGPVIPEIRRLDIARDGHHYDIATSQKFVLKILQDLS
jgi:hypothetical protein